MSRSLKEILLAILLAGSAQAVPVVNSPTGLGSPSYLFDFTNPAPTTGPNGTGAVPANNSFFNASTYSDLGLTIILDGSVTYNPGTFYMNAGATGFSGDYIGTYTANSTGSSSSGNNVISFQFSSTVRSMVLAIQKDNQNFTKNLVMSALRGGVIVETFTASDATIGQNGGFFGFANVAGGFDTLQITDTDAPQNFYRFDTLAIFVPELDPRLSWLSGFFSLTLLAVLHGRRARTA